MRTSIPTDLVPSSRKQSQQNGFSLVEVMVVVFIIGLASAAVILTLPGGGSKVRGEAEKLAARMAAARDRAILETKPMAVWVRPSGYGFERFDNGEWQLLERKPLETQNWQNNVTPQLDQNGQVRIVFDMTGLPSQSTSIALQHSDGSQVPVSLSASGELSVGK